MQQTLQKIIGIVLLHIVTSYYKNLVHKKIPIFTGRALHNTEKGLLFYLYREQIIVDIFQKL